MRSLRYKLFKIPVKIEDFIDLLRKKKVKEVIAFKELESWFVGGGACEPDVNEVYVGYYGGKLKSGELITFAQELAPLQDGNIDMKITGVAKDYYNEASDEFHKSIELLRTNGIKVIPPVLVSNDLIKKIKKSATIPDSPKILAAKFCLFFCSTLAFVIWIKEVVLKTPYCLSYEYRLSYEIFSAIFGGAIYCLFLSVVFDSIRNWLSKILRWE